ncbi:hypothetical protein DFH07DRAFT_950408 [Mycena maculata]|uniref:Uncharacterized protein n=1 Tax=Mycena maculata TaxID=230809 RepID=A0AAD7K6R1_9AGAR|nr:hypothetical protein DFH07DRAFT_950408 [Mycena maculata]
MSVFVVFAVDAVDHLTMRPSADQLCYANKQGCMKFVTACFYATPWLTRRIWGFGISRTAALATRSVFLTDPLAYRFPRAPGALPIKPLRLPVNSRTVGHWRVGASLFAPVNITWLRLCLPTSSLLLPGSLIETLRQHLKDPSVYLAAEFSPATPACLAAAVPAPAARHAPSCCLPPLPAGPAWPAPATRCHPATAASLAWRRTLLLPAAPPLLLPAIATYWPGPACFCHPPLPCRPCPAVAALLAWRHSSSTRLPLCSCRCPSAPADNLPPVSRCRCLLAGALLLAPGGHAPAAYAHRRPAPAACGPAVPGPAARTCRRRGLLAGALLSTPGRHAPAALFLRALLHRSP